MAGRRGLLVGPEDAGERREHVRGGHRAVDGGPVGESARPIRPVTASIVLAVIAREWSGRMVSLSTRRRSGTSMVKVGVARSPSASVQGPGGGRRGQGEGRRALAALSMVM